MKKIKLEVGQVWQVPDKKWIRVRVITFESLMFVYYVALGNIETIRLERNIFLRWIRRNNLKKPIGMYDFETGKVRVVK